MATRKLKEKAKAVAETRLLRPPRARPSPEEVRKRMEEFDQRKEAFIASVREGKD